MREKKKERLIFISDVLSTFLVTHHASLMFPQLKLLICVYLVLTIQRMVCVCVCVACVRVCVCPAYEASGNGHTATLARLLANKVDINTADTVHQFKIFSYFYFIEKKRTCMGLMM